MSYLASFIHKIKITRLPCVYMISLSTLLIYQIKEIPTLCRYATLGGVWYVYRAVLSGQPINRSVIIRCYSATCGHHSLIRHTLLAWLGNTLYLSKTWQSQGQRSYGFIHSSVLNISKGQRVVLFPTLFFSIVILSKV